MTKDKPYEEPLGGSYVVDKATGERKRVEYTRDDHLEVKPEAPAVAQDEAAPKADRKGK